LYFDKRSVKLGIGGEFNTSAKGSLV